MKIELEPGNYVLAVSGGVDSVVLLDLLAKFKPTVAHFDHGIREDSAKDAEFVKSLAGKYGLEFELGEAKLGPGASEAVAREARYKFLNSVRQKRGARLITAHHQDDLLETAIINLLRGTGPYGLANMLTGTQILRPLLSFPKAELLRYAKAKNLAWREDITNQDESYLRNHVRRQIIPRLGDGRQDLLDLIYETAEYINFIEQTIIDLQPRHFNEEGLIRIRFVQLDFKTAGYFVRSWLLKNGVENVNTKLINRVTAAARTLKPGKQLDLDKTHILQSQKHSVKIVER